MSDIKINLADLVSAKGDRAIYLNCTFHNYHPSPFLPHLGLQNQQTGKERIEDDEEFHRRLIEYIQEKTEIKLPSDTLDDILSAESEFLAKNE